MKSTIFFFIAILVYVDADVYTIIVSKIRSQNEKVLSIEGENSVDASDIKKVCLNDYVIVRQAIEDTPLYDGYGHYVDINVKKSVLLCNDDVTELSGTISYILLNTLGFNGFDDEIACPIDPGVTCLQKEFRMVSGNFEGVFENSSNVTLEIILPALVRASFSISKQEGFPTPEPVTDSSAEEKYELEKEIQEGDTEVQGEQAAAEEEEEEQAAAEEEQEEQAAAEEEQEEQAAAEEEQAGGDE